MSRRPPIATELVPDPVPPESQDSPRRGAGQEAHGRGWSAHHRHGPRWWRIVRLRFFRFREPLRSNRHVYVFYRTVIATLGALIMALGLILVPLPGPGWLIVLGGVAIISTEFHWARALLRFARVHLERWTRWIMARPLWVRLVVGGGGGLVFAAAVYLVLLATGVPALVPEWLVPAWTGLTRNAG